jgi:hypothetical protein
MAWRAEGVLLSFLSGEGHELMKFGRIFGSGDVGTSSRTVRHWLCAGLISRRWRSVSNEYPSDRD